MSMICDCCKNIVDFSTLTPAMHVTILEVCFPCRELLDATTRGDEGKNPFTIMLKDGSKLHVRKDCYEIEEDFI